MTELITYAEENFVWAYEHVGQVLDRVPQFTLVGFLTSYACFLLLMPLLLIQALACVCAMTEIGPARKTFSSFFILVLGTPVYPIVSLLVLAIVWIIISFVLLAAASGP